MNNKYLFTTYQHNSTTRLDITSFTVDKFGDFESDISFQFNLNKQELEQLIKALQGAKENI